MAKTRQRAAERKGRVVAVGAPPIDLDAAFGPPKHFPRADAIAQLTGVGEGWWYSTKLDRQTWAIEGALIGLQGDLGDSIRIVFPREPLHAMVAVVETTDHRVGIARSNPDGVHIAPPSPQLNMQMRRRLASEFGSFGTPW